LRKHVDLIRPTRGEVHELGKKIKNPWAIIWEPNSARLDPWQHGAKTLALADFGSGNPDDRDGFPQTGGNGRPQRRVLD